MSTKFDSRHKLQVTSDHIPLTVHSAGVISSRSVGQMRVTTTTSGRCYAALRRYWNMQVVWIDWKMRTASCNGCFVMTAQPFGNHGTRRQRRSPRQFLMPLTCGQMKYGVKFSNSPTRIDKFTIWTFLEPVHLKNHLKFVKVWPLMEKT